MYRNFTRRIGGHTFTKTKRENWWRKFHQTANQQAAERFFMRITTKTLAEQVSKLLTKKIPFSDVLIGVNREICDRLSNPGRRQRTTKTMLQGDLRRTASMLRLDAPTPVELRLHGLNIGDDGFLIEKPPGDPDSPIDPDHRAYGYKKRDRSAWTFSGFSKAHRDVDWRDLSSIIRKCFFQIFSQGCCRIAMEIFGIESLALVVDVRMATSTTLFVFPCRFSCF
ncbi:hypothetical protein N7488_011930 [Penicillium malachiteum]|nr:hypothetical protein N7488_011930 [Penicillium malachiteum]